MPYPSSSLATLRPDLDTLYEFELEANQNLFIGNRVCPTIDVANRGGTFGKIPIEELLKQHGNIVRHPATGYWRDNFSFTEMSYATKEYGKEEIIDENEANAYRNFIDAERFATRRAAHTVLNAQEQRIAATIMDFATYTGSASLNTSLGNGAWNTAGGTPITDIENAANELYNNTGLWPNALIINRKVFRALRLNPQVISAIVSAGAGSQSRARDVTTEQLAAVFDIDNVFVAGGSKNTAGPSAAASISQIWGNHAMVCRVAESNDMAEPCIARAFHWTGDGSMTDGRVETYRDETIRADIVRVRHQVVEMRLYTELGNMIPNVLG